MANHSLPAWGERAVGVDEQRTILVSKVVAGSNAVDAQLREISRASIISSQRVKFSPHLL